MQTILFFWSCIPIQKYGVVSLSMGFDRLSAHSWCGAKRVKLFGPIRTGRILQARKWFEIYKCQRMIDGCSFLCLMGCFSMIVWTPTDFECLICMRFLFLYLHLFSATEKRSRNTLIIIIKRSCDKWLYFITVLRIRTYWPNQFSGPRQSVLLLWPPECRTTKDTNWSQCTQHLNPSANHLFPENGLGLSTISWLFSVITAFSCNIKSVNMLTTFQVRLFPQGA